MQAVYYLMHGGKTSSQLHSTKVIMYYLYDAFTFVHGLENNFSYRHEYAVDYILTPEMLRFFYSTSPINDMLYFTVLAY